MDIDIAIEEFLTALVAERGLAINTIEAYRRDLMQYRRFLAEQGVASVSAVQPATVTKYVAALRDRGAVQAHSGAGPREGRSLSVLQPLRSWGSGSAASTHSFQGREAPRSTRSSSFSSLRATWCRCRSPSASS